MTGFKLGICNEPPAMIPGGDTARVSRSLCMLSKYVYKGIYQTRNLNNCLARLPSRQPGAALVSMWRNEYDSIG